MATPVSGRSALTAGGALVAVAFLAAMIVSGRQPVTKWLVKTVPSGVMRETPDQIDRVELVANGRRWVFVRGPGGWRIEAGERPGAASLTSHLDDSIKFMHVAAPVRVMERAEWTEQGLKEFGLEPPAYSAVLFHGGRGVLGASFGSLNPEKVLQYMTLAGGDRIYLMPRFIGEEWEQALRAAAS